MLLSELKANLYGDVIHLLVSTFNNCYLVSQQPSIPPLYYIIPSAAKQCEEALLQAKKEFLFWGARLGLPAERCLLLSKDFLFL
jgi:hypothetical protein